MYFLQVLWILFKPTVNKLYIHSTYVHTRASVKQDRNFYIIIKEK